MFAKYKGKKVKVTKLGVVYNEFISYPILYSICIEYKEGKKSISEYVDVNQIEFLD